MCSVEKVLSDARNLISRQKEHVATADSLVAAAQSLYLRVDAMKQYEEDLTELNELARHRPRASLILGLVQENSQLRELRAENRELRASLGEHQGALELIMSKYREHMTQMILANRFDQSDAVASRTQSDDAKRCDAHLDKIGEMASVMRRAISLDDASALQEQETVARLRTENATLRRLVETGDVATAGRTAGDGGGAHEVIDTLILSSSTIKMSEKPIDRPAKKSADNPADRSVCKPKDKLVAEPAKDKPTEKLEDRSTEKPEEKPTEKSEEKPSEKLGAKPTEKPGEKPTEKSKDVSTEKAAEKTVVAEKSSASSLASTDAAGDASGEDGEKGRGGGDGGVAGRSGGDGGAGAAT